MNRLFWLFLALLAATAYHRSEHFDEAWCAEEAYWLLHGGQVRSELFSGLNGWEKQIFVFHKGFIYFGALVQGLFGFSLPVGKAISAFWALAGGMAIWWHLRWVGMATRWIYLALLLYVANGMLIEYAFVNRPETMYMALGFISFSLLARGRIVWAGVLAGLAVLTHLNSLCFVVASVGWLFWQDRRNAVWPILRFGSVATAISLLYFTDALLANQLPTLWSQFSNDPATMHVTGFMHKLLITSKLHELLFHSEEEAAMSALVLTVTLLTFSRKRRLPVASDQQSLRLVQTGRYLLLLLGSFALITKSNTDYYYLIFVPAMCSWVAQCVASWPVANASPGKIRWRPIGFSVLLVGYLLVAVYKAFITINWNLSQPVLADKNARLAALINQPGARIIAPLDFFYDQYEHYQIHGLTYYQLLNQKQYHDQLTIDQFFQLADADSAVAVISDYGRDFSYRIKKDTPARVGRYRRVYQDEWNAVYLLKRER